MKKTLFVAATLIVAFYAGRASACPLNGDKNSPSKSQQKQDLQACKRPSTVHSNGGQGVAK